MQVSDDKFCLSEYCLSSQVVSQNVPFPSPNNSKFQQYFCFIICEIHTHCDKTLHLLRLQYHNQMQQFNLKQILTLSIPTLKS